MGVHAQGEGVLVPRPRLVPASLSIAAAGLYWTLQRTIG